MKSFQTLALGLALITASLPTAAQIYQWKDSSGRTVISDTPPPAGAKGSRAIGGDQPRVTTEKPEEKEAGAAKSMAEKDMEFKKRQKTARDAEEKKAQEEARARQKQEVCEQMRRNIATLESNLPIATTAANGEQHSMDKSMRYQEIERLTQQVNEQCN